MSNTQLIEHEEIATGLKQYNGPKLSTAALVLDAASFESMMRVANVMASGKSTIPSHLRNNPGDCLAVVMQSMQWKMNPFAVSQKTHLSQSGALGYEAQLVSAVVTSRAPIKGRPTYTFIGDWNKVLGKVEERKSDKGGKYYVATYTKKDEEGLGVIVSATFKGEDEPREVQIMMSQAYPRFSTQWATDPKQQICYLAIRKWARLHTPDVLLGVYTPEELEERQPERDITPPGECQEPPKPASRTAALKSKLAAKPATDANPRNPDLLAEVVELIAQASNGKDLHAAKAKASELVHPQDTAEAMQAYQARTAYLQGLVTTKDDLIARVKSANTDDDLALLGDEARQLPDVLADEVYAAIKDRREVI